MVDELGAHAFRLLFDAMPRPMFAFDRESLHFLAVNDAACAYYGWSRAEFLALTLRDIRPPDEQRYLTMILDTAARHTEPQFGHAGRHVTRDGRTLEVEIEISRVEIDGRLVSLAVVTDMSGVAAAERRFRLLVEKSADGIAVVAPGGQFTYVSPGGERLLGATAGQLAGGSAIGLTEHADLQTIRELKPNATAVVVSEARHADGSSRWLETSVTNLTLDPVMRGFVANFRDVTARISADALLRRSEANFRTLTEHVPTAILVHRDGILIYVNPAAVALLRHDSAAELVGRPLLDFIHPEDREAAGRRLGDAGPDGVSHTGESRMLQRDGGIAIVEGDAIALDFDGAPAHVLVGRDVGERRELFARMAVADRILSVGTLAAGVAHEVNNPLAYVSANLELLELELPLLLARRSRFDAEQVASILADARAGTERVAAIVRDLRALSRPDDDSTALVDVAVVLGFSIKMAQQELRLRARVVTDCAEGLCVRANATRLGQVFLNLLLNAAHAIPEGQVDANEIGVRAFAAADGRGVCVAVRDTGVGIPGGILNRIFDPFFTTKPVGVGMGLGLSISHQIVRALGGEITVASTPGRGSTFTVTLPAAAAEVVAPRATAEAPARPARILMIDDEPAIGRAVQMLLEPDHEVTVETRARDGLARLAAGEQFDAIVCDLIMPETSGMEFYEQVRRIAPDHVEHIVFISGGAFTPTAHKFIASLAVRPLEKPFTEASLRRAIESARRSPIRGTLSA